jgi:hypothetical protein
MDFFTRTRTLVFIIILLLCLNIGMLVLFLLGRPVSPASAGGSPPAGQNEARIERLLKEEMGFDRGQIDRYIALRRQKQERTRALDAEMNRLKDQMFDGAMRDDPTPMLSDSLLALTHAVQDKKERLTFQYLVDIKNICTPDQREKLGALVHQLLHRKPGADDTQQRQPRDPVPHDP